MARSSRADKYIQLREQFPFFIYEKQEYALKPSGLEVSFTFNLADQYRFSPTLFIPRKSFFLPDEAVAGHLDNIVFNIGMIELISYWKAACPPRLVIRPFSLHPEQVSWWKTQYYRGLGEFFYLNSIPATVDDFMQIEVDSELLLQRENLILDNCSLIPVGGGKDSAVTLELLGSAAGSLPLIMNPRGASVQTIVANGFLPGEFFEIRRTIDPQLLRLNDLGFLNGHTPFSALLAFVTLLAAILSGRRNIALSNESSASEATIDGTEINHQYSKSFQFETDFRDYVRRWISEDLNYFSFLRPLNELQIASLFSRYKRYHPVFKSCNAGSKTDTWCGKCAKCLFTYIMLSPFLAQDDLVAVFGKNLLADGSLKPLFDQLAGIAEEKPFDCVGTIREVNLALCETIRQRDDNVLPDLLAGYLESQTCLSYMQVDFATELFRLDGDHYLEPGLFEIISSVLFGEIAK
ncbi:MAG: hypothetical protein WCK34_02715 [Bacteroidota bacterium]